MKKWIFTIIGGVVLIGFVIITSIAWYHFFAKEEVLLTNFQVFSSNSTESITNQVPMSDDVAIKDLPPYEVKIKNNGTGSGSYKMWLEELNSSMVDDGCNDNQLLDKSQLRYQITLNGVELAIGELSEKENNILDIENLAPGEENVYQIRIWVAERSEQSNWWNKHFHYKIRVNSI